VKRHRARIIVYSSLVVCALIAFRFRGEILALYTGRPHRTVNDVVKQHEPQVRAKFEKKLGTWPPKRVELVGLKQERVLEVWGAVDGPLILLETYPILAASGKLGTKLKEGDQQVPEGIYSLPTLNANSSFHLSILVGYPNDDDKKYATTPDLGGEIYVHGKSASIGCLAMGDAAIEEIFTVAALVDDDARRVIIAPIDFRKRNDPLPPPHIPQLYEKIAAAMPR
jgi:murein L,D-transpeptidase YafK